MIEEEPCNYARFMELLKKVGGSSKWDQRKIYHTESGVEKITDIFAQKSSHLWVFKKNGQDAGFCQTANIEQLTSLFNDATGISEIYKIGLFPKHVGKGLGQGYVSSVLREIFKDFHTVYLNTRDTNMVNSVPFYQRLGFEVFRSEKMPDDLQHQ